jgi:hypothetical protein
MKYRDWICISDKSALRRVTAAMNVLWHVTACSGVCTAHSVASAVRGQLLKSAVFSSVDISKFECAEHRLGVAFVRWSEKWQPRLISWCINNERSGSVVLKRGEYPSNVVTVLDSLVTSRNNTPVPQGNHVVRNFRRWAVCEIIEKISICGSFQVILTEDWRMRPLSAKWNGFWHSCRNTIACVWLLTCLNACKQMKAS